MAYRKQPLSYLFGIGTLAELEQYFLVIDCIIIGKVKVEQLRITYPSSCIFCIQYLLCKRLWQYIEADI